MGIGSKPPSKEYQDNYDKIFGKKDKEPTIEEKYKGPQKPRVLNQIERADLREDLKITIRKAKETKV